MACRIRFQVFNKAKENVGNENLFDSELVIIERYHSQVHHFHHGNPIAHHTPTFH